MKHVPPIAVLLNTHDGKNRDEFISLECLIHKQGQKVTRIQIYYVHIPGLLCPSSWLMCERPDLYTMRTATSWLCGLQAVSELQTITNQSPEV
jgi:hypothetical protein